MNKDNRSNNTRLSRRIFLYLLAVSFISIISFGFFLIQSKLSLYHKEVHQLEKTFSETKKLEIKNKILQIKDYIQWIQTVSINPLTQTLSNQINQLKLPIINTAKGVQRFSDSLPQEYKDSIYKSRIPIYILNDKGVVILSHNPLSKKGMTKLSEEETKLLNQIKKGNTNDKGALSFYKHSNSTDSTLQVVAYYNKLILPGLKVVSIIESEYFELVLQIHVLDSISKVRYSENEYIFVNTLFGKALITNGKYNEKPIDIHSSGNKAWTNIFKVQQSSATKPEGVFHTYNWQKLSSSGISLKTSYFSYIPSWEWIIGTGFYEDDINSIIKLKERELYDDMRKTLFNILFYLLISTLLCYFLGWFFFKRLGKNIELFKVFFEKAAKENILIDKSQVNYKEFIFMAEAANLMVAERKTIEKSLVESEAQYRYLFDHNPAPMLIYELGSLKILAVNDAFVNHYEYTKDDITSMKLTELYPDDEKKPLTELILKLTGHAYVGEWHHIKKDGTQITIEVNSHGISYEGRTARIAVISDITERKQIEKALQKSEELYRIVFENTGTAAVMIEEKTTISLANAEFEKLSGYSKLEIEGKKSWTEFVLEKDIERIRNLLYSRREEVNSALKQYEFRFLAKNGNIRDILLTFDVIPGTRRSVASLLDITERKLMEESMRINETHLSAIYNTISDVLYLLSVDADKKYIFVSANEMFLKTTGLRKEQVINKPVTEVIPQPARELVLGKYQEAIESRQSVWWEEVSEYPSGKKYGLVKVTPTYNSQGICTNLVGSVHDITKIRENENEIRQLNAILENRVIERTSQLEASNKELESFSYSISHDLRAPLRAIFGFSQILSKRHRASLNEEGQQYMDYIVEASIRMEQLINDLLNYSRLGRKSLDMHPVSLQVIINNIYSDFEQQLKQIDANFIIEKELPKIMGDETLLRQIFTNLIGNSITYRRTDVILIINISYQIDVNDYILKVSDNGIGIPKEYWEKIFNVFQRLHSEEQYPGTGIGLATVKKAVNMLGGNVWVESVMNEGSSFYIKFPQIKI